MLTNEVVLNMNDIGKSFGGIRALDGIDLEVHRGEILAICGENGAGKSTLMNVLSGVYPHGSYDGTITYLGEECKFKTVKDSEHRGIVIIHQELALSPFLSVAENLFLGSEITKNGVIDWHETHKRARVLLDKVGLNVDTATRVTDLGVGQQQLIEIAKALGREVKLLILDEPTAALNDEDSAHLLSLMRVLQESGVSQIIISHKLGEIEAIADRVVVIRDGSTVGSLDIDRSSGTLAEGIQDEIISMMVGRALSDRFPHRDVEIGEEVLRLEHITSHHPIDDQRKVVDDACLTVHRGEVVGLAGLMGAGRTELAMAVFGRSYGTKISGDVYKSGKKVDTGTVLKAVHNGLAYVPEDRKALGLNLIESIDNNITAASLDELSTGGVIDRVKSREVISTYSKSMRIKAASTALPVSSLSGGNQQKVVLAKWIATQPDVLILDEPTRGIDVGAKYEIYEIINQLAASGRAVLMISSELPEILGMCDRIYTMCESRITGCVPGAEATQESLMKLMTHDKEV